MPEAQPAAKPTYSVEIDIAPNTTLREEEKRLREAARHMSFPRSVFQSDIVAIKTIRASGFLAAEYAYLALGGGIGSFVWVDHLRIFGVSRQSICVLGDYDWNPADKLDHPRPYANYRRLCRHSQIPNEERLRSNSLSAPDNIWGFPGYASRETLYALKNGHLGGLRHIFKVFGEPALAESYTPRSGDVFASIDREAVRIGWRDMCVACQILALRKTDDGRYAAAIRVHARHARDGERDRIIVARFVHLAMGYPAYRTEQDVFTFQQRFGTTQRTFRAYDDHEVIYRALESARRPVAVAVRGREIVASRILQRLHAARIHNPGIQVYHQMRTAIAPSKGARYGSARRPVSNNTELQPFNWPKACWGGELRHRIEAVPPEQRSQIFNALGGTTTAYRSDWEDLIRQGLREGWYRQVIGRLEVKTFSEEHENGKVLMEYEGPDAAIPKQLAVDYVIDCIGLIADVSNSEFLSDLIDTYHLPRNRDYTKQQTTYLGITVTPDHEIVGLRNEKGRVYASGQITAHGPYAAVDSFLGLQYSALRSVDHLYALRAPGVSRFGALRSLRQWLRWCANRPP